MTSVVAPSMPAWPTVVYWDERAGDWWPDLGRKCRRPHCGGDLIAVPPDAPTPGPGAIACSLCCREVAEVQDTRPPVATAELLAAFRQPVRLDRPPTKPGRVSKYSADPVEAKRLRVRACRERKWAVEE